MTEPYHLTIRFRQQGSAARLNLETESGAGTDATLPLPYAADLPLVLRALDIAQYPNSAPLLAALPAPERARLVELGLLTGQTFVADLHARVGRTLLTALTNASAGEAAAPEDTTATILALARSEARASGRGLALNLRFPPNATQFADLPWELLWDAAGQGGVPLLLAHGGYSACVRYLTLPQPRPAPAPPGSTLSILSVSPHAEIGSALLARQRQALTAALEPTVAAGTVHLIMPPPPLTAGGLIDLVAQHRPTVLSFYGHGQLREGVGHLLLDAPDGGSEWVPVTRLAPLAQSDVRLLLLHACRSDQPGAGLLTGTAGLLSALGLPAIVAMQSYLRITAATRLQATLCRGLAEGQSVQEALAWARAVLYAEERDAASWYVPTLTIASRGEEPLVLLATASGTRNPGPAAVVQAGVRRRARRVVQGVIGTSALALLAATSVLPLLTGFTWENAGPLLASLGGNALAGWLITWAEQHLTQSGWLNEADEERTLGLLAGDLEGQL
ncbi:MAG: CHAT domain-containing protein, partial [Chloroflexales bacterium]